MTGSSEHINNGQAKSAGRPAGGSIGRALAIRPGVLNDDLRAAIEAIDQVHGVTGLAQIPMEFCVGMRPRGRILFDPTSGLPARILVRLDTSHRTFSSLHEVGHLLDLTAFRYDETFGSSSNPVMFSWSRAVRDSGAYRELERYLTTRAAINAVPLLDPAELWARCYAQYTAIRSGQTALKSSVEALRSSRSRGLHIPMQWDDNDFDDIAATIDQLFESRGWRT